MVKIGVTSYRKTIFGILPRHEIIKYEVEGTEKGLIFLQHIAQKQTLLSSDLIKRVHKMCFADILPDDAGVFRKIQVTYSSKEAPLYTKVPELMQIFCEDIEYAIKHLPNIQHESYIFSMVEILARFHHRFVYIHPIIEISANTETERKSYIRSLQKADIGEYVPLERLIERALNESFKSMAK